MREAALIHVSGITLAIIEAKGRRNLLAALAKARAGGAIVSFDPNLRRKLWPDEATLRAAMIEMFETCDIALPSFDDERALWGDADPKASAARFAALGVGEIVVKNGAGPAYVLADGAGRERSRAGGARRPRHDRGGRFLQRRLSRGAAFGPRRARGLRLRARTRRRSGAPSRRAGAGRGDRPVEGWTQAAYFTINLSS